MNNQRKFYYKVEFIKILVSPYYHVSLPHRFVVFVKTHPVMTECSPIEPFFIIRINRP